MKKILCLFIILKVLAFSAFTQKIQIVNCSNLTPVKDVIIFSENGKYLGITNDKGLCFIGEHSKIKLSGLNIKDTLVEINTLYDFESICVNQLTYRLEEFVYTENKIDLKSELLQLLLRSHEKMIKKDTTIYYNFINTIIIPDSNWSETISGVLKVVVYPMSKKRVYARVFLCKSDYKANEYFLKSSLYNNPANNLSNFIIINTDFIFNNQKNIKKNFIEYVDKVYVKNEGEFKIYETHLKGADININLNNKENMVFKNDKMFKRKYYSTSTDMRKAGILKFYKEINYTGMETNFIETLIYKSITKYSNVFFVKELELKLAEKICEDCIEKPINYKTYNLNYQDWIKEK